MTQSLGTLGSAAPLYRIDKFAVPPDAMAPFMARVRHSQSLLAACAGIRQNLALTQVAGPGELNVVTVVEWANGAAMAAARSSMQERYAREGFDPEAFMKELGVRADVAVYAAAAG